MAMMFSRRRALQIGVAALALDGLTPPVSSAAGTTTWNTTDKTSNATLGAGNLSAGISGGVQSGVRCTNGLSAGKAFFELTVNAMPSAGNVDNFSVGISDEVTKLRPSFSECLVTALTELLPGCGEAFQVTNVRNTFGVANPRVNGKDYKSI